MKKIVRQRKQKAKVKVIKKEMIDEQFEGAKTVDSRVELIQMLIPLGLKAVGELLQTEVEQLAGKRYVNDGGPSRWGTQNGSVYLADEKYRIEVPRLRDRQYGREVQLESYESLQHPQQLDERVMTKILLGLSTRRYKDVAEEVPGAFGMSASTVSKRYVRGSQNKLNQLLNRVLDKDEYVAIFIDGKSFGRDQMIIAVGITIDGVKHILGVLHAGTENERVISEFFEHLLDRGLNVQNGLLFIVDGSRGLLKAIRTLFKGYALIQRCQWHKRENIVSYLAKRDQETIRQKLRAAYTKPTYQGAKNALLEIKKELVVMNQSAANSLEEGLEETLTLHRLSFYKQLSASFKTTNVIESINARVGQYTDKVDYWKNSNQKLRWVASALLDIEPRLNKVKGAKHLRSLQNTIQKELGIAVKNDRKSA